MIVRSRSGACARACALLMAAISTTALASDDTHPCKNAEAVAVMIMEARQNELPASKVVEAINKTMPAAAAVATLMVEQAYGEFPMQTEDNKRRQSAAFGSRWYLACMKSARDR